MQTTAKFICEKLLKCNRLSSLEDQVIDQLKAGNTRPFIEYFSNRNVQFAITSNRHMQSPSGRVVYENDIYSYILIDGTWVGRMFNQYDEIEQAVMSNIPATIHYKVK